MKIVFAGSSEFAVPFLEALLQSPQHKVLAVYTQPDRPAGRGLKLASSPVKAKALEHNIPVCQPVRLGNVSAEQQLYQLQPDVFVTAAYSLLLPPKILSIPRLGCINVHPSLLPRWRGAAPMQHAILAGDANTGVSIMQMDAGLDTGDILQQTAIPIADDDTAASLSAKLTAVGVELFLDTLNKIESSEATRAQQNSEFSTFAGKIQKEQAAINWCLSAAYIERMVRAFNPWPIAYSIIEKHPVRIWNAEVLKDQEAIKEYENVLNKNKKTDATASDYIAPGTIISAGKNGIDVLTGNGVLRILELQLPGKKVAYAQDAVNGYDWLFKKGNAFDVGGVEEYDD